MLSERIIKFHTLKQYQRSEEIINRLLTDFSKMPFNIIFNKKVKYANEMEVEEATSILNISECAEYLSRILKMRNNEKGIDSYDHSELTDIIQEFIDDPYLAKIKEDKLRNQKLLDEWKAIEKKGRRKVCTIRRIISSANNSFLGNVSNLEDKTIVAHKQINNYNEKASYMSVEYHNVDDENFDKKYYTKNDRNGFYQIYESIKEQA